MIKLLFFSFLFIVSCFNMAFADSLILMLADGMGKNHISCAQKERALFFSAFPVNGEIRTHCSNRDVTDSAAAATAYACGIKTKHGYVGLDPDGIACENITEKAIRANFFTALLTTDLDDSPSPAGFYAHVNSRYKREDILAQQRQAAKKTIIRTEISDLAQATAEIITQAKASQKDYFILIEEENIDIASHANDLEKMTQAVYDFDLAVKTAVNLASPDTTIVVLADHETGDLSSGCRFRSVRHTAQNVPVFAIGKHADLFSGRLDNTQINYKMNRILATKP